MCLKGFMFNKNIQVLQYQKKNSVKASPLTHFSPLFHMVSFI